MFILAFRKQCILIVCKQKRKPNFATSKKYVTTYTARHSPHQQCCTSVARGFSGIKQLNHYQSKVSDTTGATSSCASFKYLDNTVINNREAKSREAIQLLEIHP